jgi:hypothetical protein
MRSRRIKEEFKGEEGLQIAYEREKISNNKRKREWILFEAGIGRKKELGGITRKSKRTAEVEV